MQGTYFVFFLSSASLLEICGSIRLLPFRHDHALLGSIWESLTGRWLERIGMLYYLRRLLWSVTWQWKMPRLGLLLSYSDTIISLLDDCSRLPFSWLNNSGFLSRNSSLCYISPYEFIICTGSIFREYSWLSVSAWLNTTFPLKSITTSLLQKLKNLRWLWDWFLFFRGMWSLLLSWLFVWNLVYITYYVGIAFN